jgi:hypothetical protein
MMAKKFGRMKWQTRGNLTKNRKEARDGIQLGDEAEAETRQVRWRAGEAATKLE